MIDLLKTCNQPPPVHADALCTCDLIISDHPITEINLCKPPEPTHLSVFPLKMHEAVIVDEKHLDMQICGHWTPGILLLRRSSLTFSSCCLPHHSKGLLVFNPSLMKKIGFVNSYVMFLQNELTFAFISFTCISLFCSRLSLGFSRAHNKSEFKKRKLWVRSVYQSQDSHLFSWLCLH